MTSVLLLAALTQAAAVSVAGVPTATLTILSGSNESAPDAQLNAAITEIASKRGGVAARTEPSSANVDGTSLRGQAVVFGDSRQMMQLFFTTGQNRKICHVSVSLAVASDTARVEPVGRACVAALQAAGAASPAPRASPSPAPRTAAPAPPAAPRRGNWTGVESVYFESGGGFGVGGMVVVSFSPVILFKDGRYFEVGDTALEDVDLAASRASEPVRWGQWRRVGTAFLLTNNKGQSRTLEPQRGRLFKAYPASAAPLRGAYRAVGGGGSSAMGGNVTIATSTVLNFSGDGRFTTDLSSGAFGGGYAVGADRHGGGRYAVQNHTLTLTHADGRVERFFFAYGSKGAAAQLDPSMIFVGERPFTLKRSD